MKNNIITFNKKAYIISSVVANFVISAILSFSLAKMACELLSNCTTNYASILKIAGIIFPIFFIIEGIFILSIIAFSAPTKKNASK